MTRPPATPDQTVREEAEARAYWHRLQVTQLELELQSEVLAESQQHCEELEQSVEVRNRALEKANRQLREEVEERRRVEQELLDSREQLRRLSAHMTLAREEDRKRMARDIHDELGQNLLALRIDVDMLRARTGEGHPRLHQRVALALENVDATIRSVRGLMNRLRPAVLDLGLQAAIEWLLQDFERRTGVRCALDAPDEASFSALDDLRSLKLFRILQEALQNVQRHAGAGNVRVTLALDGADLRMVVQDDGCGIPPALRSKPDAFGLIGMAERAAVLGGVLRVAPYVAGQGCRLELRIPLSETPPLPF